ncbi:hypothetical protein [Pseudoalteromonas mariniglutinosa]|uniref:hypothetical protein n=1 Tax=Pseudoalteromonas mariniglutinosa TaxID=206042 RepID=UPI00384FE52F
MYKINLLLAKVSIFIALILLCLLLFTPLWHSAIFSLVIIFWSVITVSSLYRVTFLFKVRNPIDILLTRDINQLMLIGMSGLFDFKNKAQLILITDIINIELADGYLRINTRQGQQFDGNVNENKSEIASYLSRILATHERESIVICDYTHD